MDGRAALSSHAPGSRLLSASARVVLACILLTGVGACQRGAPPTVVLITIDTLRADRVGCYGHPHAGTPNLDALAAAGTRFALAETTAPLTQPAHTSLLTGRTIPAHRVPTNGLYVLPADVPTLAAQLRGSGYATGAFVSSRILARRTGLDQGFDEYDDAIAQRERTGPVFMTSERAGVETVRRALRWMEKAGRRPAFLWVHLWEPHDPYTPPPEFAAQFPGDPYQGEVATADAAVGEFLRGLRAAGRDRRLLVVVAGDHGESLGEHGEPTHGIYIYQATMHVPLVIAGASFGVRGGAVVNDAVSLVDIAPTLLDLTGSAPLPYADGVALTAVLKGTGSAPARDGVSAESHMSRIEYGWSGLRALVHGTSKVVDAPRPEFYDLAADPAEQHDLAAQHGADIAQARRALADGLRRAAAAASARSNAGSTNEEDLAALRALGYAASGRQPEVSVVDLVAPGLPDPKDRREFVTGLHDAMAFLQQNRPKDALPILARLETQEPRNLALLLEHGNALMADRRLNDALAIFRRIVALDSTYAVAHYRIGQLLDARGDVAGAEAAYRRAVEVDPSNTTSLKALAAICYEQKRFNEGIALLERVVKLDPSDAGSAHDLRMFKARAGL